MRNLVSFRKAATKMLIFSLLSISTALSADSDRKFRMDVKVSALSYLQACAELQRLGALFPQHIHAVAHSASITDDLSFYIKHIYTSPLQAKLVQLSHKLIERFREEKRATTTKRTPYYFDVIVLCDATTLSTTASCSIPIEQESCISALINVHKNYCTFAIPAYNSISMPILPFGLSCDPRDLLNPQAAHHEGEKILKNLLHER
jgi:hypothetical protein